MNILLISLTLLILFIIRLFLSRNDRTYIASIYNFRNMLKSSGYKIKSSKIYVDEFHGKSEKTVKLGLVSIFFLTMMNIS